jgi:carboxymethylenebutenolidase
MCTENSSDKNSIDRRTFLAGASTTIVALGALNAQSPADAHSRPQSRAAQQPALPSPDQIITRVLDNPDIQHGPVIFKHGGKDTIDGFLARPKAAGQFPPVIVIAGNVITEEYIPNTCAALAVAGFVGLAPNIFHTVPPQARTPEERRRATANHTDADALQDIQAGIDYLMAQEFVRHSGIGVVGFCYGGKLAMMLGARSRLIDAVVPYHPGPTTAADIARLVAPTQIHMGTADRNVSVDSIREIERLLKAQGTPVEVFFYEGADHGFLAYTRPYYDPSAAQLSWERTVHFLREKMR